MPTPNVETAAAVTPPPDVPPSRYRAPSGVFRALVAMLIIGALAISGFLFVLALRGGEHPGTPGCAPGTTFDCDHVLHSPWSVWLRIPVSALAIASYVVALAALLHVQRNASPRRSRRAWTFLIIVSISILGGAVWFVGLQLLWVKKICLYCMTAHGLGTIAGIALLWRAPIGATRILPDDPPDPYFITPRRALGLVGIGLLGVTAVVVGQIYFPPPQVTMQRFGTGTDFDTGPGQDREITFLGGRVHLKPHNFPVLDSADATHLMVYMFDYTCPHCRILHKDLRELLPQYRGKLGIVLLPAPLDANCNPLVTETEERHKGGCDLARLALAVWREDPEKFVQYDAWLFASENPRTVEEARAQATTLLGEEGFAKAWADPWPAEQIQRNLMVYKITEGGVIPKMFHGPLILLSRPSREDLIKVIGEEMNLHLDEPAAPPGGQ